MLERYIQICNLLDCLGHFDPRLNTIQKIIQQPDFHYDPYESPEVLMSTFLSSSYWLDRELFDEGYLYKRGNQNLSSMQRIHLKMVDIGACLLNKGFPLRDESEKLNAQGPSHLVTYIKIFTEQCYKRHEFLHRKISHKEKNILPQKQKTLA